MQFSKKQRGFSLIELMIVVAIISVLAAIAIPSYQTYVLKAQIAGLIELAAGAQTDVAEYMQGTGDNTCTHFYTNYPQYGYDYVSNELNPTTVLQVAYGNIAPIFQITDTCGSLAGSVVGSIDNFNYIFIGNIAKTNSDGSINWSCAYAYSETAPPTQAQVAEAVPAGCVQLRGNNQGGGGYGGYGGGP